HLYPAAGSSAVLVKPTHRAWLKPDSTVEDQDRARKECGEGLRNNEQLRKQSMTAWSDSFEMCMNRKGFSFYKDRRLLTKILTNTPIAAGYMLEWHSGLMGFIWRHSEFGLHLLSSLESVGSGMRMQGFSLAPRHRASGSTMAHLCPSRVCSCIPFYRTART